MMRMLACGVLTLGLFLPGTVWAPTVHAGQTPSVLPRLPLHLWPADLRGWQAPVQDQSQPQQGNDQCQPWQHKDENGNCVDNPNVVHHHGDYTPEPGETCWVECMCQEGEYPSGNSCSPCSYVGMVCTK